MRIAKRIFLVPLANNNHGKSTIIKAFVSQGIGRTVQLQKKGQRSLTTPWGRSIDAYVFGRSYQEVERAKYKSVLKALDGNDPLWRTRELLVMPSHIDSADLQDVRDMVDLAHSAGFDAVCAPVLLEGPEYSNRADFREFWKLSWDERWTIPNPWNDDPSGQLHALGGDLLTWASKAIAG